jgi:hypothetical protein
MAAIIEGSYIGEVRDGRSFCKFSRLKALQPGEPFADQIYNISSPNEYHYLMAHGVLSETGKSP